MKEAATTKFEVMVNRLEPKHFLYAGAFVAGLAALVYIAKSNRTRRVKVANSVNEALRGDMERIAADLTRSFHTHQRNHQIEQH